MSTSKKILIADDSELVHHICKARLAHCKDYVFLSAKNGRDAYKIFLEGGKIDLIILDLNMPLMNGIEFIEKMKRHPLLKAPVIVLSTDENEDKLKVLRSLGVWAFIAKSQTESFVNIIADALADKPSPLLKFC
jgi:two-component system chemotaxis response regulator CheY